MRPTNPDIDPLLAWVKQEQAAIWQQVELMEAGKIATAQTIEQLKLKLSALEGLLTEAQSKDAAP
jgi:hypothetical protein